MYLVPPIVIPDDANVPCTDSFLGAMLSAIFLASGSLMGRHLPVPLGVQTDPFNPIMQPLVILPAPLPTIL